MKKLFVIFGVLALSAGMAFGQTSDVNQDGNDNEATVEQDVNGPTNSALVNQLDGKKNEASILQELGSDNSAVVNQLSGNKNEAMISQEGEGVNNNANVTQENGNKNEAAITQEGGSDNSAVATQKDGNKNSATISQEKGDGNTATAYQEGNSNNSVIEQPLSDAGLDGPSHVWTDQIGNQNDVYVRQQYNNGENYAIVDQQGHKNDVHMVQDNKNNYAEIHQWGNNNAATINLQRNFGGDAGRGFVYLMQEDGNKNDAFIDQDGRDVSGDASVINQVYAHQIGNKNFLDVDQMRGDSESETNEAYLTQDGNKNVLRLEQAEAPSYANILQDGNKNRVAGTDADFAWNKYDHAYQDASQITISQDGNKNEVGLYQENNWTNSVIMQNGDANQTLLYQTDGSGYANVWQDGTGNQANVWQSTE